MNLCNRKIMNCFLLTTRAVVSVPFLDGEIAKVSKLGQVLRNGFSLLKYPSKQYIDILAKNNIQIVF